MNRIGNLSCSSWWLAHRWQGILVWGLRIVVTIRHGVFGAREKVDIWKWEIKYRDDEYI